MTERFHGSAARQIRVDKRKRATNGKVTVHHRSRYDDDEQSSSGDEQSGSESDGSESWNGDEDD